MAHKFSQQLLFLEAFNFQEMDFNEADIVENMRQHKCGPNNRTYENFLTFHCRHKQIEKVRYRTP